MRNLIGEEADDWRDILAEPDMSLHLYGKMRVAARPQDGPCDAVLEGKGGEGHRRIELKRCLVRPLTILPPGPKPP